MGDCELRVEVVNLINEALKDDIDNFLLSILGGNEKGKGYLSEFLIISLKNKISHEKIDLVIKQANSNIDLVKNAYTQEIYFYEKIWPRYVLLQKTVPNLKLLDIVPKCLATDSGSDVQRLILENLATANFKLWDKKKEFDLNVAEQIFKSYGKFHALSFIFKYKYPEECRELLKNVEEINQKQKPQLEFIVKAVPRLFTGVMAMYKGDNQIEIKEKLAKYVNQGEQLFRELETSEDTKILIHGDCWSNNFMFKFDDLGNATDIRILDFQLIRCASPVHDLSIALYSGSSKEVLNNLEHLLKVYHQSLTEMFQIFNCNPDSLYSFDTLKKEWKKYGKFGFMKGVLTWSGKLVKCEDDLVNIADLVDRKITSINVAIDEEKFSKVCHDLVWHMYENDFL